MNNVECNPVIEYNKGKVFFIFIYDKLRNSDVCQTLSSYL